jgi:hypothetical protein
VTVFSIARLINLLPSPGYVVSEQLQRHHSDQRRDIIGARA